MEHRPGAGNLTAVQMQKEYVIKSVALKLTIVSAGYFPFAV